MNVFELAGQLTLDGADKVKGQLSELEKNTEKLQKRLKMAGAAFTAIGAAGLKLVADAKKLNAQLGVTAITLGSTTEELREMTLETANVTFSIDEVIKTFDLLSRAGVRGEQVIKDLATFMDTLGDATGRSASVVTSLMIPGMKTFNFTADEMKSKGDKLTWLFRNTTVEMEAFNSMMGYVSPEMVAMGFTMEDMIAIMARLEDEGYAGELMMRKWRSATTEATNEQKSIYDVLGWTTEQMESYNAEMEDANGLMEESARAANEQYGILDKLKFMWSKLTFTLGSVLTPLEPIFVLMTAMGPVMIFLSTSMGRSALAFITHATAVMKSHVAQVLHVGSSTALAGAQAAVAGTTVVATRAFMGLRGAMMAIPIVAIGVGIYFLVQKLRQLYYNWEVESLKIEQTWVNMKDKVLKAGREVIDIWGMMANKLPWLEDILLKVSTTFSKMIDINKIKADALAVERAWQDLAKAVEDNSEQIITDVEMATDQAISSAKRVALEEKRILEDRAQYYRDLTAERLGLIDEQMMAELVAMDPSGEVARLATKYNESLGEMKEEGAERDREIEEDRIKALEKELRSGEDLSRADKRRIEDQIADYEEAWRREELTNELHLAIMGLDSDVFFEGQKTVIDSQLATQVKIYEDELVAFKQLNTDKLTELRDYVNEYNRILEGAGLEPGIGLEAPAGPPPPERTRPSSPAEFFEWMQRLTGMQHGGMITEPTLLYGLRSQRPYAIAGEAGREVISPAGASTVYNISFPGVIVREELDITKIGEIVAQELRILQDRKERRIGVRSG